MQSQPSLLPSGNRAQATTETRPQQEKLMAVLTRVAFPSQGRDSFARAGGVMQCGLEAGVGEPGVTVCLCSLTGLQRGHRLLRCPGSAPVQGCD